MKEILALTTKDLMEDGVVYVGVRSSEKATLITLSLEKSSDVEVGLSKEDTRTLIKALQNTID